MNENKTPNKKKTRKLEIQKILAYLLVMIFFIALIVVYNSLLYVSTQKNIIESGEMSAVQSAEDFDDYLSAGVDTIKIAEYSVTKLLEENAPSEKILEYLTSETEIIMHSLVRNTTGLYAYINGEYYDGAGWVPDDDYVPTERPWYIKSTENKGSITVVDPYLDMQSGTMIITLAKCLDDNNTVIALDITMDEVQTITERISAGNSGMTEMLLCGDGTVVAHSDKNELGKNYLDGSDSLGNAIAEKISNDPEICFDLNYKGNAYIVYAVKIQNGWYSISVVESGSAYLPLRIMLIASGAAIIVTIVIVVLIMLRSRKKDIVADQLNVQLSSAADIYISLCDLDIENNSVTAIRNANPAIAKAVAACDHNMQEIFNGIMGGLPESPTKQAAIDFCDLSKIDEKLKDKNTITVEYLSYGNIWVRGRYVVSARKPDGKITHVLWMLENIDAERRARELLTEQTEKLTAQLSSAADIYISLCDLDIPDNSVKSIKNANPAIAKVVDSCDHNMQELFFGIMNGLPESPTKQAAIDFCDLSDINERLKDTNTITVEYLSYGNIWVRGRYVVSERDSEGKVTHVLWMLENIDAEKRARDRLSAVAEKLNNQMSSIASIYMTAYDFDLTNDTFTEVRSTNSKVIDAVSQIHSNANAQKMLLMVMDKIIDDSAKDAIHEFMDLSTLNERLRDTKTITIEYLSNDKTWRRARFIESERSDDGTLSHVLLVAEDIDKEKKDREKLIDMSERAIAANEAKSAFLSNMSHEIRTPINAVLGMNEMVLRECSDPAIITYSESIRTAGTTLLGLINDILDFSKIEAGKMEIIPVDYDLAVVLNDLVNMIQTRLDAKGLMLITDFDRSMPHLLHGDEVRIKQIITNILTNAVKYTEQGNVTFSVTYEKLDNEPDGILLKVAVKDTGIGIKKEDMAKLFSKFERIEEERNRTIEGTGLGMSITQSLLSMMGSRLDVESVYGEGSVFGFSLHQQVRKWDPVGDYEQAFRNSVATRKKYQEKFTAPDAHVLVVDDTVMNLLVFTSLLKSTQIKIDTVESGDAGIALALKNKYDIIFLDHMMPQKDGIETLRELKSAENNPNRDTPMICLTANAISGAREKYLEAGFNDYLTKPIESAKLEEMICEYLPPEKMKFSAPPPAQKETPKSVLPDSIFDITELDVVKGINNAGSEGMYLELLKTYADMMGKYIDDTLNYWLGGDIANMTIKLHSLKGASRTVGAKWIMQSAQKLEDAGNSGDCNVINSEIEELAFRCRLLGAHISSVVNDTPQEKQK